MGSQPPLAAFFMFYVYILFSEKLSRYYVGYTSNIESRLDQHNQGKEYYTSRGVPWEYKYSEKFANETEAIRRERAIRKRVRSISNGSSAELDRAIPNAFGIGLWFESKWDHAYHFWSILFIIVQLLSKMLHPSCKLHPNLVVSGNWIILISFIHF